MISVKGFDLIILILTIVCKEVKNGTDKEKYMGSKFPTRYLVPEDVTPTVSDINHYIESLRNIINYFNQKPNNTDINIALGHFYSKALLKRTILDNGDKLSKKQYDDIIDLIRKADHTLSHYIYMFAYDGWNDSTFRLTQVIKEDSAQVYSLGKFNRYKLRKWILSSGRMHDFLEEMDDASLQREKYLEESESSTRYYIRINESDICLSRVIYNPVPINVAKLTPCRPDPFCKDGIHASPSIAYGLTHRLFNLMLYRHTRRCYFVSPKDDAIHMDILCSFIYRETVYLARRGYFARDLFLENVALCGLLGYEEFHRRHWFYKAASWLDEQGCLIENPNFEINRTKLYLDRCTDSQADIKEKLRTARRKVMSMKCHTHPMALSLIVMANAIRHAVHLLPAA